MAFNFLGDIPDVKGLTVRFDEFGEEVVGKVEFFDSSTGKLGLIIEEDGHDTCLQLFYQKDCENCQIVNQNSARIEESEATSRRQDQMCVNADIEDQDQSVAKVIKAHMTEDEMKKVFKDVSPRVPNIGDDFSRRRGDNPHLRNLIHIKLEKMLCGAPPPGEPEMLPQHTDKYNLQYYSLPPVVQTPKPRLDANNYEINGGWSEKIIRGKLWLNYETVPNIQTPYKLFVIDELGDLFSRAVEILDGSCQVGLSGEGRSLGRDGTLYWLGLATDEEVFLFDIISLGSDAFKYGLKAIIEDRNTLKVVHDSRFLADCLYHQFDVSLVNVYDTMVGDYVFCNQFCYGGYLPANFRSLSLLLRDYLGIEDFHIFYPRYRRTHHDQDSSVWETRPSSDYLLLGAARNCLYLLSLYTVVRKGNLLPFHHSVNILQRCVRDQDDPDAIKSLAELKLLPAALPACLPDWDQDRGPTGRHYPVMGQVVHVNTANPDPLLIFSKDSMHQAEG